MLLVTPMVEPWIIISAILVAEWSVMVFMALIISEPTLAIGLIPLGSFCRWRSISPAESCNFRYSVI